MYIKISLHKGIDYQFVNLLIFIYKHLSYNGKMILCLYIIGAVHDNLESSLAHPQCFTFSQNLFF